ncbi:MAG: MBOAT family protein [Coriobacteriia bacterium]|nr:MBOAT family protein [Coriobacteriia bacterium]
MLFSPALVWIIVLVSASAWLFALILDRIQQKKEIFRRLVFIAGLATTLASLFYFKYAGLATEVTAQIISLVSAVQIQSPTLTLLMPVGISFWTFQTVAYLVDVYWGKTKAIKNPFWFLLGTTFFPIVTMGPITRLQELIPQLQTKHRFDYNRIQSGLLLIGWGFFKKLMIADGLAIFVSSVFDNPRNFSGTEHGLIFFVAAAFFAIQLYADFSGYTDIVRGSARLFGVDLPLNFRAPYFARTVGDFWRRWHMTLMDWFHDYVWLTVLYSRPVKRLNLKTRKYISVMTVFLISGLWHGAGWTFVVWGLLNGVYQVMGEILKPANDWLVKALYINRTSFSHKLLQTSFVFTLLTIAWVFFRANTMSDALYILPRMFVPTFWIFTDETMINQGLNFEQLMIIFAAIIAVWIFDFFKAEKGHDVLAWLNGQHVIFRWICYFILIFTIVIFGHYGGAYNAADFIYFQF